MPFHSSERRFSASAHPLGIGLEHSQKFRELARFHMSNYLLTETADIFGNYFVDGLCGHTDFA